MPLLMCLRQADDLSQPTAVEYWTTEHGLNLYGTILIYACLLGKQMAKILVHFLRTST